MTDVWQTLKKTAKPIILYGMGDGADKILDVFELYGIKTSGIFASDGFVKGKTFRGFKVVSYADIIAEFGCDIVIVFAFASSVPSVLARVYELAKKHELYAPDVPVVGDELFCAEYYMRRKREFDEVRAFLADEQSRSVYDDVLQYKLSGDVNLLQKSECGVESLGEILPYARYAAYADIGAYNGDTIKQFAESAPNLKRICAVEPDARNYKKLVSYAASELSAYDVTAFNVAAWNEKAAITFNSKSGRSPRTIKTAANVKTAADVQADTIDNLLAGQPIDFIKYDVEGAELNALLGSVQTIKKSKPDLSVALYHRTGDIIDLPKMVRSIVPEYNLYIRRLPYIPAWDLQLYCVI
jgi:FkbM family methyltransferase